MDQVTIPNKAYAAAAARQVTVLIPWPSEYIGEYGSAIFDGSPVSPEACDCVMDRYVAEIFDARGLAVMSVIAGRVDCEIGSSKFTKIGRGVPTPVIHVTVCEPSLAEQIDDLSKAHKRRFLPAPIIVWARPCAEVAV